MSRPYFETKVVKVKKEKEREHYCNKAALCIHCGEMLTHNNISKPKGNWVNGENLDKIKFPCFCSYNDSGNKKYGILTKEFYHINNRYIYGLVDINLQYDDSCGEMIMGGTLRDVFLEWDIHILKGKIIIYDEEE